MIINSSRRHTGDDCPQKYYWNYERNIVPKTKYVPFMTGSAVHAGLASWYTYADLSTALEALETTYRQEAGEEIFSERQDLIEDEIAMGKRMLKAYTETYPSEPWEFQRSEQTFKMRLGDACPACGVVYPEVDYAAILQNNDELMKLFCVHCGRPIDFAIGRGDLTVVWKGMVWLVEFKTAKQASSTYMQSFSRAHQTVGYVTMQSAALKTHISGVLLRVLKKTKVPDFLDDVFMYSNAQRQRWIEDTQKFCDQTRQWEADKFWPQRTEACFRFGRCSYEGLCSTFRDPPTIPDEEIMPLGFMRRELDYTDDTYIKEERR